MSNGPDEPGSAETAGDGRFRFSLRTLLAAVFVCGVVFFVLFHLLAPAIDAAREARRRAYCTNNLKQIFIAFHNYQDIYGVFPSAYMLDAQGKPFYSWRLAIAPYLSGNGVYLLYDFGNSWDNASNLRVAKGNSPWGYVCEINGKRSGSDFPDYVMIVGDEAASQPGKWSRLADLDDPANTILVAEIADSDIFWTEPRDLEFDKMSFRINDLNQPSISSHHPGGAHALMADGSVRFLANDTDPGVVRALCTRDASDNP